MKWRAYPRYKDSGAEWLGDIPSHWRSKRLKYGAMLINEKVDGPESDLPYTGLEHIGSLGFRVGRPHMGVLRLGKSAITLEVEVKTLE